MITARAGEDEKVNGLLLGAEGELFLLSGSRRVLTHLSHHFYLSYIRLSTETILIEGAW